MRHGAPTGTAGWERPADAAELDAAAVRAEEQALIAEARAHARRRRRRLAFACTPRPPSKLAGP